MADKTKEQIEHERTMEWVGKLLDPQACLDSQGIAIRGYIWELQARIAELEAEQEGGRGRTRAKRAEAAEQAAEE